MTAKEHYTGTIEIPRWIIQIVAPIIVGGLVGLASFNFSGGEQKSQTGQNTEQIKIITERLDKKVNYEPEFAMLLRTLDRIENKLDKTISDQ